ncbi:hypothetical protein PLESTB_000758900 [Pleodorina starrii]|uniref:Uncharacterized protein n=1 Tax=Pleodorina starrii TaxID=330485 RepID=A0A9W6BK79_9CHLO|nr:hypothetical protein PLESTB_000758900 [Pleodorina starrii]GLC65778.1 hypothetical protein PLESTF_000338900 [Pleodorina starrii]
MLLFIELEQAEVVTEALVSGLTSKNPKVVVAALDFLHQALASFGHRVVTPQLIIEALPALFESKDGMTRDNAKGLVVELASWMGPGAVRTLLFDKMRDAMRNDINHWMSDMATSKKPARLTRKQRSMAKGIREQAAAGRGGGAAAAAMHGPRAQAAAAAPFKRLGFKGGGSDVLAAPPPIPITSEQNLRSELEAATATLALAANADRQARMSAMQRVEGLVLGGAADWGSFHEAMQGLARALAQQFEERRSTVARQACHLIAVLAHALGRRFEPHALALLPKLSGVLVDIGAVMVASSNVGVRGVLRHCQTGLTLQAIADSMCRGGESTTRTWPYCASYLVQILEEWNVGFFSRHTGSTEVAIYAAAQTSSADARQSSSTAMALYDGGQPGGAEASLEQLHSTTQDTLAGGLAGSEPYATAQHLAAVHASRVWLPGIVTRIVRALPANEIACTSRLIDKATAREFANYRTVRLSLPSPTHAFRKRWGSPDAFRGLTRAQRRKLLCLTAASGNVDNLEIALANAGFVAPHGLLEAAAAAGQLVACQLLRERDCPWGKSFAAAAQRGHRNVCEWMLASGCPFDVMAVHNAARRGHVGLMHWLMVQQRQPSLQLDWGRLVVAAAEGFRLEPFQRLYQQLMAGQQPCGEAHQQQQQQPPGGSSSGRTARAAAGARELIQSHKVSILATSAGSPTPDWQAKVEWLEELGYPRTVDAYKCACRGDDAVDRLQWLRSRGYPLEAAVADEAVACGSLAALRYLMEQAGVQPSRSVDCVAARHGQLAVLQYLHAQGWPVKRKEVAYDDAGEGHMPVVVWAVEALGVSDRNTLFLMDKAGESGNVELMIVWMIERGWPGWCREAISAMLYSVSEEALARVNTNEWVPGDGGPYADAAGAGDLAMLRALHRIGCPWGPPGKVMVRCVLLRRKCPIPALKCLVDLGCPVDWGAAVRAAKAREPGEYRTALLAWLDQERLRREGPLSTGSEGSM